jgi:hypothetical protein
MSTHELATEVLRHTGTPRDAWEITAHLEVMGLRDADARATYDHRDLFELGRSIYDMVQRGVVAPPAEPHESAPAPSPVRDFLGHYVAGSIFAVPMLLQAAAILTWGYGLWGALDVDVRIGTAIALGFVASYVLTGGFVQAITRRALFYKFQQEPELARWVVLRGWWIAARVVIGVGVPAGLAFNALYRFLPWDMFVVATLYYVSLSLLWLSWSMVYVTGGRYRIALVTAAALVVVVVLARYFHWSVIAANTVGLLAASAMSLALGVRALGGFTRPTPPNPPRLTVLIYATSSWFLYGLLYNTFIFADRVMAWTARTGREDLPPYSFWLSARYELGLDLALLVVMLLSGVVEASVQTFSQRLVPVEKGLAGGDRARLAEWFLSFHRRRTWLLVPAAFAAVGIARAGVALVAGLPDPDIRVAMTSASAMSAFWMAVVGYTLLMFALQNTLLLLTLSRVELAVRALAWALAVNLTVGFVASRAIDYTGAAAGLVAGAAVLLVLSWREVRRVGARLDYFYYAAY